MKEQQQLAKFIRLLIGSARAPCDDVTQQNIMAAKNWLRAIETGALIVNKREESAKPTDKPNAAQL